MALVAMAMLVGPAKGAESGWYVGGAYSDVSQDPEDLGVPPMLVGASEEEDGFKLLAGWRPMSWLALEAAYLDLGSRGVQFAITCPGTGCPIAQAQESRALTLGALGMLRAGPVDLFVRAGIARVETESEFIAAFVDRRRATDSENMFAYGAGLQYNVRSLAIRLEYETFDGDEVATDALSLGVIWRFR